MNELSVDQALAVLQPRLVPLRETETVALSAGTGRVLAADVISAVDLPAFDNAAMDGYALRAEDILSDSALSVIGQALAGRAFAGRVGAGEAVRIMTGASLPNGANAVVMREHAMSDGKSLRVHRNVYTGMNVRSRAEHVRCGEAVLLAGRRLRTHDIGLAASVGSETLSVFRRLRVAILSTGDELIDPPQTLTGSSSYDGNRPLLVALLARFGADVIDLGISADAADDFAGRLDAAARARADVVLTTGGAAQGDADVVRQHGQVEFMALDFRPGRGLVHGELQRGGHRFHLLGLPGNAVAAYVMYQLLVRPLLGAMAGAAEERPCLIALPLAVDVEGKPGRIEWRRGRLVKRYGGLALEPLQDQGSAMLRTVSEADVLIGVGPEGGRSGEPLDAILLATLD